MTDLVEDQVARTPQAPAVATAAGAISYAELDRRANRLARRLQAFGVGPDVPVGVFAERSPEMAVGLLGVLKAGGACLPLDPLAPAERVTFMLADSAAPVVLTQVRLAPRLPSHHARVEMLDMAGIPDTGTDNPAARTVAPHHLAYVLYTSGSTGRPKGVMLAHRALVNHHLAVARLYALGAGDRVLQFCSMSFDVSVEEMFPTWASGATLVLRDDAVPILGRPWLDWLRRQRITMLNLPTAYWHEWVRDLAALGETVPDDVRIVTVGGEKALGRAYRTWLQVGGTGIRWLNAYGPTEACIGATWYEPPADGSAAAEWIDPPIGWPLANTTVHVLDPAGDRAPPGTVGELHIGGPGLARGYLNQPQLTAERFIADPFRDESGARLYRTGDLVTARPDGCLEFIGRLDQQVKVRGFRIEPAEVERALADRADVVDAAVVVREEAPGERRLVAYVVPVDGAAVTATQLRRDLAQRLPRYMVPTAYVLLDVLPKTPGGKIDRRGLPPPVTSSRQLDDSDGPVTPTEQALAVIWCQVLGVDVLAMDDDFFDLGGHSLSATQVVAEAREAFGVDVALQAIFETPTVRGLAALVDALGAGPSAAPPLVATARRPGEMIPLSLAQQQMWRLEAEAVPPGLYNVTVQHRFEGPVATDVLLGALEYLIARHETLRTGFLVDSGQVFQSVAPDAVVDLPVTDLSSVPEHRRERELQRRIAEGDAQPLQLDRPPLFQPRLYRLSEKASVFTATFDHMISDGTSAYIFLTELEEAYAALVRGQAPALPPLRAQYADFALWQTRWLTEDRLQAQLGYWTQKLAGMPLGPALPFDCVPTEPTRRIVARDLLVPAASYRGLKRLAREGRSTMFMVAAAAVEAVLSLTGGATDIVLSTTLSGRQRAELEGVIGFFAGIGRIRTDLAGDPSFEEIVRRTRRTVIGLFDHQDIPFMQVRQVLFAGFTAPGRGSHPLAALPIEFQYFHAGRDGWAPGLGVVERPGAAKGPDELFFRGQLHPLSITLLDNGEQLWGEVNYKLDFYRSDTIERLASGLLRLIEAVVAEPHLRLSDLAAMLRDVGATTSGATSHRPVGSWQLEE